MIEVGIQTKRCTKCGKIKPLSDFYIARDKRDGRFSSCKECVKAINKKWRERNPEYFLNYQRRRRIKVIDRLGGECVHCGFDDFRALQIDHINGGGHEELRKFDNKRSTFYSYLLRLPKEELLIKYQCLCSNCNWIKRAENEEWR